MKRASYREAIEWIACNDDTEFLDADDPAMMISVTAALVRDIFGVEEVKLLRDLRRAVDKDRGARSSE